MSLANNPFLEGSPAIAATTLRPMRAAPVSRSRNWPETVAAIGFAAVLAASLALKGAAEPMAFSALSLALFAFGATLALSSTLPETRGHPWVRNAVWLAAIVASLPFVQAGAALFTALPMASAAPRDSLLEGLRLAGFVVLFVGLRHCLRNTHSARRGAMMLLGAIAALACLALLGYDPDLSPLAHPGLTGPFENRSAFAALMGMGLCIAAAFATQPAHPRAHRPVFILFRTTCLLACAVLFVAVVQSQSRLGLASALLGVGVVMAFRIRRSWLTWALASAFGLAGLLVFADPDVLHRFATLSKDMDHRSALYHQVAELAQMNLVWGHGAGSFAPVFEQVQRPPVSSAFVWDYAHSTFLTAAAELGAIATCLIIVAIALIWATLAQRFQHRGEAPALAGCAALVLAVPHWMADFSFELPALPYFLIALTALGLGPKSLPKKEEAK